MKKIGIIGCGTIGTGIAEFIQQSLRKKAKIAALCDVDIKKAQTLSKKIKPQPQLTNINNLIRKCDLIIEAASPKISGNIAQKAVLHKKEVLIMSTGGLLKFKDIKSVYVPSGAVCGIDGIRAAAIGKIKTVTLTTRKPPKGLRGAPYLEKRKIDIDKIKKETVIYNGTADDAVKHFPKNINVAATLSLSGIGPSRTVVRIVTSPEYTTNSHEVEVVGEFGRLFTKTENVPSKQNPKTSQLAIYSALAKLKEVIG